MSGAIYPFKVDLSENVWQLSVVKKLFAYAIHKTQFSPAKHYWKT